MVENLALFKKINEEERNMEYPKKIMGATELRQMGFPRSVFIADERDDK